MLKLRDDGIVWREVGGETLLLDLRTSMYLTVTPSAALLWRHLAAGTTREILVQALVTEYGIGADQAAMDVDAFLDDCRERRFIEEGAAQ